MMKISAEILSQAILLQKCGIQVNESFRDRKNAFSYTIKVRDSAAFLEQLALRKGATATE